MATAAVIGANGQLGTDVCRHFRVAGWEVHPCDHDRAELTDADGLRRLVRALRPDLVVNTAAMHNVERCEEDPLAAFAVNAVGSRNLALVCAEAGAALIHVSTDYVFDGAKARPYAEDDPPRPLNVYAASKLAGEFAVLAECPRAAVVRVSGLYGHAPCRAKGSLNFVMRMLALARERPEIRVVDDEILTPTRTEDVARQLVALARTEASGVFHATAQGGCSWYEFAARILATTGYGGALHRAAPGEFPAKVRRPKYTVLDNAALRGLGVDVMPAWQDGLDAYLREAL